MHHFAIFDPETGEIKRAGMSSNRAAITLERKRLGEGEALYAGKVDPSKQYLPGGVPTPRPEVVPVVEVAEVKAWAGRLLSYTDWYVTRSQETKTAIPEHILAYRQAVRDRSGKIEAMNPIPADYRDLKWWPEQP